MMFRFASPRHFELSEGAASDGGRRKYENGTAVLDYSGDETAEMKGGQCKKESKKTKKRPVLYNATIKTTLSSPDLYYLGYEDKSEKEAKQAEEMAAGLQKSGGSFCHALAKRRIIEEKSCSGKPSETCTYGVTFAQIT